MSKTTILDQPARLQRLDKSNMLHACERLPDTCQDAIKLVEKFLNQGEAGLIQQLKLTPQTLHNIVVVGMGGSAIGGELLKDWLSDKSSIPVEISRDYTLPAYVDKRSFVIAISYSGETEETLNAFIDAIRRQSHVLTISTGGRLEHFSERLQIPHLRIPSDLPAPRAALGYTLFPLVILMEKLQIAHNIEYEIDEALTILKELSEKNALKTPFTHNNAKRLAFEIGNTIPIVCGQRERTSVARRIKCQLNENSKIPAKFETFPELNHNEIVGWEDPGNLTKHFSLLLLRDKEEPPRIRSRIELTKEIAVKIFSKVLEIHSSGQEKLAKMLSTMYVGDFVSIYLALLRGIDPTPTENIAYLKQKLKTQHDLASEFKDAIKRFADKGH